MSTINDIILELTIDDGADVSSGIIATADTPQPIIVQAQLPDLPDLRGDNAASSLEEYLATYESALSGLGRARWIFRQESGTEQEINDSEQVLIEDGPGSLVLAVDQLKPAFFDQLKDYSAADNSIQTGEDVGVSERSVEDESVAEGVEVSEEAENSDELLNSPEVLTFSTVDLERIFEEIATQLIPETITDTADDTTVSLAATASVTEEGGTVTYTATVTNAAETDVTVTLDNGQTITIAAGETSGSVDYTVAADEDVYLDASSISAAITEASGGNYENLVVDSTPATTSITDNRCD